MLVLLRSNKMNEKQRSRVFRTVKNTWTCHRALAFNSLCVEEAKETRKEEKKKTKSDKTGSVRRQCSSP